MKFESNKEQLLAALQSAYDIQSKGMQMLPILRCTLLEATESGELRISATDLEVSVEQAISGVNVSEPGRTAVHGRKLYEICRAMGAGGITVSDTGIKTTVRSGSGRFVLADENPEAFPSVTESGPAAIAFDLPANSLNAALSRVSPAMANKDVRFFLNGMLLEISEEHVRVVATDGHRMALHTERPGVSGAKTTRIIIPRNAVMHIAKMFAKTETLSVSLNNKQITVEADGCRLTSGLIDGAFPDYARVLPSTCTYSASLSYNEFVNALKRVRIAAADTHPAVRLTPENGEMLLSVDSGPPRADEARERIDILAPEGEPLEAVYNIEYLSDMCKALQHEDTLKLDFAETNHTLSVVSTADANVETQHVIMPMRL